MLGVGLAGGAGALGFGTRRLARHPSTGGAPHHRRVDGTPLSGTASAGFTAGLAVMYPTAMLVSF